MNEKSRDRRARLRAGGAILLLVAAAMFVAAIWTQDARWALTGLVAVGLAIVAGLAGSE